MLEPKWLGALTPHRIQCVAGHIRVVKPNHVQQGQGICGPCARNDSITAEAEFKARITALGGTVLEPVWLGAQKPHRVQCAFGHICNPRPYSVANGQGICRYCAGQIWDVFYIIQNTKECRVKFGITSGSAKSRLADHAYRQGYCKIITIIENCPNAHVMETTVRQALARAGHNPAKGREYYYLDVLPVIQRTVRKLMREYETK